MSWLQVKFRATRERAAALIEALEASGALSVSVEDAADERMFQAAVEHTPLWNQNHVTGLFSTSTDVADVLTRLQAALGTDVPPHQVDTLPDADWTRAWMTRYQPVAVGQRLWICPSWCAPPDPAAINIMLDPGVAFGTGEHPTTALCLEWLSEQALAGRTLIDYGCGSGILAIAALKLGARHVYAVDLDPLALVASRENAARNGVGDRLTVMSAEAPVPLAAADVVVANILAGTLIELAPRLATLVHAGGLIVLAGVLTEQIDELCRHYTTDFVFETRRRGEWVLLAGTKRREE